MNCCSLKSCCENWKEVSVKDFHELSSYSVPQALDLGNMFK